MRGSAQGSRRCQGSENTDTVQRVLWSLFLVSVGVVLYGSCLNSAGLKYSRVSAGHGRGSDCSRELLVLSVPESNFCCDGLRSSDWVCVAAYDEANRKLTSHPWAYLAPFVPWVLTAALIEVDIYASLRRFLFYSILLVYRTYILYIGFGVVQSVYTTTGSLEVGSSGAIRERSCWYSVHRRSGDCIDNFDFSDHIMFYIAQIVIPSAVEIGYVLGFHSVITGTGTGSSGGDGVRRRWKHWLQMFPTIVTALVLVILALRAMLFTSIYFHTPKENIVALSLAFLFAVVPTSFLLYQRKRSAGSGIISRST